MYIRCTPPTGATTTTCTRWPGSSSSWSTSPRTRSSGRSTYSPPGKKNSHSPSLSTKKNNYKCFQGLQSGDSSAADPPARGRRHRRNRRGGERRARRRRDRRGAADTGGPVRQEDQLRLARQTGKDTGGTFVFLKIYNMFPQVQMEGDSLFLLHWDGRISLFSVEELLSSRRANDELMTRLFDFCHN